MIFPPLRGNRASCFPICPLRHQKRITDAWHIRQSSQLNIRNVLLVGFNARNYAYVRQRKNNQQYGGIFIDILITEILLF